MNQLTQAYREQIAKNLQNPVTLTPQTQYPANYPAPAPPSFGEPTQNDFGLPGAGMLNQRINLLVAGLGVLASTAITSLVKKYVPSVGRWAGIIAGAVLIAFGKGKGLVKDFGVGVLLGGTAIAFENFADGLAGRFGFSENAPFQEIRVTQGGLDGGLNPTSPGRRVKY